MQRINVRFFLSAVLALTVTQTTFAGKPANTKNVTGLAKTTTDNVYRPMDINNIFNYYSNNGDGSFNPFTTSDEGFEFPIGSNEGTCVFEDGLVWTAFKNGTLYCGGSTYNHGLQAGSIITNGTATNLPIPDDPTNPANRSYRVRPDIRPTGNADTIALETTLLQNSEVGYIDRFQSYTAGDLLQQYWNDWNNWPANEGAPYTDVNHDGVYEPGIDIPGVPGADQTIWMVMNDVNQTLTQNLYSSNPIGIEVQRTIWAYNRPGALGNTIFVSYKFINKSGVELDSMYVAQWSDPDLGYAGDDATGCDTTLSLGYVYNGEATDASFSSLGLPPPSAGFDFFQGPKVPGAVTDTAIFEGNYIPGYKNLPMTTFTFFINGNTTFGDPNLHSNGPNGTQQWYNLMRGMVSTTGAPFPTMVTGGSKFCYPGDPVTGLGPTFIGPAAVSAPADVRMALCSGPFTMAPGDTQQVVVAALVGLGADYLSSITALKANDNIDQQEYNTLFSQPPPGISFSATPSGSTATISFVADARSINASAVTINLRTYTDSLVATVALADDGLHNDGGAGDKIFGNSVQVPQFQSGLYAEAVVVYPGGKVLTWSRILNNITTTKLSVPSYSVASDNVNEDGIPNPGENVRYIFSLKNNSSFGFSNLTIHPAPGSPGQFFSLAALSGNSTYSAPYDQNNPATYLAFDVPRGYLDSTITIVLTITDVSYNQWIDTLVFPVKPLGYNLYGTPLTHVTGFTQGNFSVWIVDSAQVKNHLYIIRGVDSIAPGPVDGYTIKDSTTGTVLIQNHPLPDVLGHTSPIVDGFKLLLGNVNTLPGMNRGGQGVGWNIPSGARDWSSSDAGDYDLEGFNVSGTGGAIGMGRDWGSTYGAGTSTVTPGKLHNVLVKFATIDTGFNIVNLNDPNVSMAYRFVRHATSPLGDPSFLPIVNATAGYAYQDRRPVPFAVFDEENNNQQLDVGFLENNAVGGKEDGKYDPPSTNSGIDNCTVGREYAFIFATNYNATVNNPAIPADLLDDNSPMMWWIVATMRGASLFTAGDEFEIIANNLPSSKDLWTFNPSVLTNVKQGSVPYSFTLMQNYPNPFNPSTTIRYELLVPSKVTLTVYNVLGQKVRTLVNGVQNAGPQLLVWDSKNDAGNNVASGVYFYRIQATAQSGISGAYSAVKKMVLLR
ncbi:MAG: FlgD immunoglobulin-like domain containing protein [Bacteroidota bacterium]